MKHNSFSLHTNEDLYLRVPNLEKVTTIELDIPSGISGKILKVMVVPENEEIPFSDVTLKDEGYKSRIDYIGDEKEWEFDYNSIDDTIPGHPNCTYGECGTCMVVSCGIYQGYEPVPERPVKGKMK